MEERLTPTGANVDASNLPGYQGETTIAINPTNPLNMIAGSNNIATTVSTYFYSTMDGGQTWCAHDLGGGGDPAVAFDLNGIAYASSLATDGSIAVSISWDGGQTWPQTTEVAVPPSGKFFDHESIAIGPDPSDPLQERIYVLWNLADIQCPLPPEALMVASSVDGVIWTSPTMLNGEPTGTDVNGAVGSLGQLYVTWEDDTGDIMFAVSTDSGQTFTPGIAAAASTSVTWTGCDTGYPILAQLSRGISAVPGIAVDTSGGPYEERMYLTYTDRNDLYDTNIELKASDDGGQTWSALGPNPVRVNDDNGAASQFFGALAIDQTNGTVNLAWYDARNDPNNKKVDLYFASSSNGGQTFAPNQLVTDSSSDESSAQPSNVSYINQFGDYIGIAAYGGLAHPVWTDTRLGLGNEEIFTATIAAATPAKATTTVLTSSANPSSLGQAITLTATVSGDGGMPTGTVTFMDGSTALETDPLIGGNATLTTSALTARCHHITAVYSGDTAFAPSTSPALIQVVNPVDTYLEISDAGHHAVITPSNIAIDYTDYPVTGLNQPFTIGNDTLSVQASSNSVWASISLNGPHDGASFTDSGNGTLNLAGDWSNFGTLAVNNVGDGIVNLQGTVSNWGSTIVLAGGGPINGGGTIEGGTVTSFDGTPLAGGGTLDGVTVNADLDLSQNGGLTVRDGLTLNGTATLGNSNNGYGQLFFVGSQTLRGSGTIVFAGNGGNDSIGFFRPDAMILDDGTTLTVGSGITIHGQYGYIGYIPYWYISQPPITALALQGTVVADVAGSGIIINALSWSNSGTLGVRNGGVLSLNGAWSTTGTMAAGISGYTQFFTANTVNLAGTLALSVRNGFTPQIGDRFTLISNLGTEPVAGTFAGLPEGAFLQAGSSIFSISYVGGDGNDVVLTTRQASSPALANVAVTSPINEGSTATLTGNLVDPYPAGNVNLVVNWGDGGAPQTVTFTAGSAPFSLTHTYLDNPAGQPNGSFPISLNATDALGQTATANSAVQVKNLPPTAKLSGTGNGVPGQPHTFTFAATDASSTDQAAGFAYAINWGDGTAAQTIARTAGNGAGAAVDHVYTKSGSYIVKVTATDKDGGISATASSAVTMQTVQMQGNSLAIGGTLSSDTITLMPADAAGNLTVNVNGTKTFNSQSLFKPTDRIFVYGQTGNDTIKLASNQIQGKVYYVTVPAFLYGGGTGNDTIDARGSTANNVLTGGGGKNTIYGGLGRDLLIAGLGASQITAGSGDDILIGGWTNYDLTSTAMTYDKKLTALQAIMAEWGSATDSYATRVKYLQNGGGLNGSYLLNSATVHDNGQADSLIGTTGSALDWFFAGLTDVLKNKKSGQTITTIS